MVRRLSAYLREAMNAGALRRDDPEFAAELFLSMLAGHERVRRLYGIANGAEAEAWRTGRIVDCFLRAFGLETGHEPHGDCAFGALSSFRLHPGRCAAEGGGPGRRSGQRRAACAQGRADRVRSGGPHEGSKEVQIRARVAGILERQLYSEGDAVKAGARLFLIDRAPLEIDLQQARASLAQERARQEQAQQDLERLKGLADRRAISQREADQAATG